MQVTAASNPGNVVNPALVSPPGVASHSVYSLNSAGPALAQQQFSTQQLTVMGLQPQVTTERDSLIWLY